MVDATDIQEKIREYLTKKSIKLQDQYFIVRGLANDLFDEFWDEEDEEDEDEGLEDTGEEAEEDENEADDDEIAQKEEETEDREEDEDEGIPISSDLVRPHQKTKKPKVKINK